jgi:hypothetical protein
MADIVMEDWNGISPTHRKGKKSQCAERGLKSGIIMGWFLNKSLVIAIVKIKDCAACSTSELLCDVLGNWSNAGMSDGDCVEGFQAVD